MDFNVQRSESVSEVYDFNSFALYIVQILKVKIYVWPKVNPFIVPQKPSLSLLTEFNSFSTQNISTILKKYGSSTSR